MSDTPSAGHTWQETVYRDRCREGDELIDQAIENSREWCARMDIGPQEQALLSSLGYCPWAARRGVSGGTEIWLSKYGSHSPIYLRDRICVVDGHEGSDLDPGGNTCIHCGGDLT